MDKTRVLSLFAVLLICVIGVGCTSPQPDGLDAEQEAAIKETLLSITEAYNGVWEQLDFEQIEAYHADDFSYYRRGVVDTTSHDDFEQSFHDNVSTQITAYWADATDIRVEVLSQNAGVVAFVFRGGVETPDGAKHDYDGALTYVFKRSGGEWQIVHIHESAYDPDSP